MRKWAGISQWVKRSVSFFDLVEKKLIQKKRALELSRKMTWTACTDDFKINRGWPFDKEVCWIWLKIAH